MKIDDRITPDGTKDILFSECRARREITRRMEQLFDARCYNEVVTPTLEFFDLFSWTARYMRTNSMFKLVDSKGRVLVIRPDCTIPIARLAATRLRGMQAPIRLYYSQNVLRVSPDMSGRSNELLHMGVELIGSGTQKSDLEIIELAAAVLRQTVGKGFRLEICHIGFFLDLMENLYAGEEEKAEIRALIEAKNNVALQEKLSPYADQAAARALRELPNLFGGGEVIDRARALCAGEKGAAVIEALSDLYEKLRLLGLEKNLILDLGLVNQADYYTGVIFRGYMPGAGEHVLSGGRYDNLLGDFGAPMPATGFAVNVDMLTRSPDSGDITPTVPEILVYSEIDYAAAALRYIGTLTAQGKTCEHSVAESLREATEYAVRRGAAQLHIVGEKTEILQLKSGGTV